MNPWRINSKAPKLPSFVEGKDQIDNYFLQRLERYARAHGGMITGGLIRKRVLLMTSPGGTAYKKLNILYS